MTIPLYRKSEEGDILVGLTEQALQAQQDGLNVVGGGPLVLEDVEADAAREIDVGVVDGRLEKDGRWSIRIVGREREAQLERETRIRRVFGALDGGGPRHEVAISRGKRGDSGRRRGHKGHQFGLEPVEKCISTLIKLIPLREEDVPLGDALGVWTLASGIELGGLDAAGGGILVILGVIHCKQKTGSF